MKKDPERDNRGNSGTNLVRLNTILAKNTINEYIFSVR